MQWVKLWVSLRKNVKFKRLSSDAKVAFMCGLMAAADYETDGAIALKEGPLTLKEMANDELLVPEKRVKLVISELVNAGFFTLKGDGTPVVSRFDEKAGELSQRTHNAARQARYRTKQRTELLALETTISDLQEALRDGVTLRRDVTPEKVTDKEEEVDIKLDTSVSSHGVREKLQPKLVSDQELKAREILGSLWQIVQPHVKGMTRTEWGKRNKRYALDLAHAGVELQPILDAQKAASERFGACVYSLRIVQDQLNRPTGKAAPAIDSATQAYLNTLRAQTEQ